MCYNCACGITDDDHGKGQMGVEANGKAITDKTSEAAGRAFDMNAKSSKEKPCNGFRNNGNG